MDMCTAEISFTVVCFLPHPNPLLPGEEAAPNGFEVSQKPPSISRFR